MKYHTTTLWKSLWIFSIMVLILSCSKENKNPLMSGGRVVDAETGSAVDSALVSMYVPTENTPGEGIAQQVYTDANGRFYFEEGPENLKNNHFEISKPPYYISSENLTFKNAEFEFLIYPKSYLKFVPKIHNPQNKNYSLRLRIGEFQKSKIYRSDHNATLYVPLPGGINNEIKVDFFVHPTIDETEILNINIPYRDTLLVEFVKEI